MSHIWQAVGLGTVTVEVQFHAPTTIAEHGNRKALTRHCEQAVMRGMAAALSGRIAVSGPMAGAGTAGGVS
jgi:1-acyl-sn-glycerol-3-phosphate acyltransferase